MLIRRVARPMLATTFVSQGVDTLGGPTAGGDPARIIAAAQIGGGLLLATGKLPRIAAATLAATASTTLAAHAFWNETDPVRKSRKRRDFMADISLLGGLIIAAVDTAGKPSLRWRGRRAVQTATHTASIGMKSAGAGAAVGGLAEKVGGKVSGKVSDRVGQITDTARERLPL